MLIYGLTLIRYRARNRFITLYDPPMTAGQLWPAFMYKWYKGDVNDLSKGLLRSEIMVRVSCYKINHNFI